MIEIKNKNHMLLLYKNIIIYLFSMIITFYFTNRSLYKHGIFFLVYYITIKINYYILVSDNNSSVESLLGIP